MKQWRVKYNHSTFFIYEQGNSSSIVKILPADKKEAQKIAFLIVNAVNEKLNQKK